MLLIYKSHGYDKFGQRTYMKYCNGAETFYTYKPQRRRLQGLKVNAGGNTIMDNAYTYDAVSNVLGVTNGAALPQSGKAGGQMSHAYTYDALYRLSSATGTYTGADGKTASYTLSMGYDNMHRITSKSQHLTQDNLQFDGTLNVGYDLTYTYGQEEGKKFQLANVGDVNYRTETTPGEDGKVTNSHAYEYDANGNLVYVNTGRVKKDGGTDEKARERKLKWDEENRLLASDDDGFVTNYWYDADGERTVKTSGESEQVYVNSGFAGGRTNTAKFSLYVSPYLVANQGGRYTKHIYIGSQRIVSKIGDLRELLCHLLVEHGSLRRHIHRAHRSVPQLLRLPAPDFLAGCLPRIVDRLRLHQHAGSPAVRIIIDFFMSIRRIIPDVDCIHGQQSLFCRTSKDALRESLRHHLRKQRQNMIIHAVPPIFG